MRWLRDLALGVVAAALCCGTASGADQRPRPAPLPPVVSPSAPLQRTPPGEAPAKPAAGPELQAETVSRGELMSAQFALAPDLSLEHRRYLLYLYARLNKARLAEQLAERILAENPGDKQTLLVLASMYIERQEAEKALNTARTLVQYYPNDDQALYFLGAAYYVAQHYESANEVFRDLKRAFFKHRLYDYQTDLASAALKSQDWFRGMLAYQELLRRHSLRDELRLAARRVLEGIYYEHLPQASAEGTGVWLQPGFIWRTEISYRQHVNDSHRVYLRYGREDLRLNQGGGLRQWSASWDQARAGLETTFSRRWRTELWAGAAGSGILGGAAATRTLGELRDCRLAFYGHEPAYDGLLLEALDGRENRWELSANYLLERNWVTYGRVFGREVVLDQEHFGYGYGINWNVEHIFTHEAPDFRGGYRAFYATTARQTDNVRLVERAVIPGATEADRRAVLEGAALREINRHGLYVSVRDQLSGCLYWRFLTGVDYAFEGGGFVFDASAGISFYPRKSVELRMDTGYSSSSRTSNLESASWQLSVGLRYWF